MNARNEDERLSDLTTLWSVVFRAHQGSPADRIAARRQLVERYSGAVRRYLSQILRDPEAVRDLTQEVAVRIMNGAFHRASPQGGRFRNYLKTTLAHLVADYRGKKQRQPRPLTPEDPEPAAESSALADVERVFLDSWRDALLDRAWKQLEEFEQQTGQCGYTMLRFRVENPEMRSPEMAERLSERLGKAYTGEAVRKALHRAREKFADLLLDEVADTMDAPTAEQVEEELLTLGLHRYCLSAVERRRQG